jgi:hypothetical protein
MPRSAMFGQIGVADRLEHHSEIEPIEQRPR